MNVSNALSRRINKKIQGNEDVMKTGMGKGINLNKKLEKCPDFVKDLCRLLTVVSAPLDHDVLIVKGSRFQFSHDFSPLLLTQIIDYFDCDREMSYYLRRGYNSSGKEIQ